MKVKVIGKEKRAGTSRKTGNPFNFTMAHVIYPKTGVEGQSCETVWLPGEQYPLNTIQVGADYNIDRDSNGYLVAFEKV